MALIDSLIEEPPWLHELPPPTRELEPDLYHEPHPAARATHVGLDVTFVVPPRPAARPTRCFICRSSDTVMLEGTDTPLCPTCHLEVIRLRSRITQHPVGKP